MTTLQAAAARTVLDRDPAFARDALEAIEDAGRAAMGDLDHVIGLLRDAADGRHTPGLTNENAPHPTLTQLARLVDDTRAAGLDVDLTVTGSLSAPPPVISREGYRIAQEALTNAVRHRGAGGAVLGVSAGDEQLVITVRNLLPELDAGRRPSLGQPGVPASARVGGGRGLAGMEERVRLLAGTMSAGRCGPDWVVEVRLPYGPTIP